MSRYRLSRQARSDLDDIWLYIAPDSLTAADRLIDALLAKKERLIELLQEKRTALITHAVTKGLNPTAPMKDSAIEWLGEIPAHWNVWTVRNLLRSEMLEVQDGNHGEIHPVASDYVSTGIPFVMANNVRNSLIDLTSCHFISKEVADRLRIGFSLPGDVLLTHKGTIGETAIVPDKIDSPYLMLTPQVTYYRIRSKQLTRGFLHRQFQSGAFQEQLRLLAGGGTTRDFIGIMEQRALCLVVPPEREQLEIEVHLAPILDSFDELMESVKSGIVQLKELRTALISAAVTGKI
ncbi:MAG: type II toxin-antitoxin system RelE/ParE family toxin, partial [Planctomycetes bacterium]|nr:type II toxin-antitoxin system RelE/ParE family toxin [Planctomycetota bacterium]